MQNTCLQRHFHVQGHGTGRKLTVRPRLRLYFLFLHESGKQKAASQWNHPPLYLCDLKQMLAVHLRKKNPCIELHCTKKDSGS